MFHFRLHTKFLLFILGSLVITLGGLSMVVVQRENHLLTQKNIEKQHVIAFAISADLKDSMMEGRPRSTLALMENLHGVFDLVNLEVIRRDGYPAFGMNGPRLDMPQLEEVFASGQEIDFQQAGDPPLQIIIIPLQNELKCKGCHKKDSPILGAVLVSLSREEAIKELVHSKRNLTTLLPIIVLLIGGILYIVIRKVVLQPLVTLHNGVKRISTGDLAHRIAVSTNDEIQDLAQSFNVMADRVEESHTDLEHRINERTSQLQIAMADVQDKARRLYAYGRDMATISRLSTRVFNAELSLDDLLDRFMRGVTQGLGYQRAMLCLVDRKRVWLDIKRDTGMTELIPVSSQSLLSDHPLVSIVRSGKSAVFDDDDPAFSPVQRAGGPRTFFALPLLNRSHTKQCWQITNCIKTTCPAHQEHATACWLMENTLCGNPLIESYGNKLAYCMICPVFPVLGVLVVTTEQQQQPLRRRRASVLRILTTEMAAALDNQRLHEENQQMVRELLELHRVTATALADLSLQKALDIFTESALKFSGIDACAFWLLSKNGLMLERRAGGCVDDGAVRDLCPDRLPLDQGLIGQAFHQNTFLLNYDVGGSDTSALGRAAAAPGGMNTLLAISLKSGAASRGVFSVHKRGTMPFMETEIAAFMLLANQAAMAINVCLLNEELQRQNHELARHTNLLSGILSSMSSGVMLLDTSAKVILVNIAGAAILRSTRDRLMQSRLSDLYPETIAFVQQRSGPYQEITIRQPDNSNIPIGFTCTRYHGVGSEYEGMLIVYQDLSEIKALQAELLNKERFAAMGRVVAGVAHEIRNPLFGISSVGQILERELKSPGHLELVRALLSETRRMNQLVEELLLYGRPMPIHLVDCDLTSIWKDVIGMHRDELDRRRILVSGDLNTGPLPAYLDANQIRQVFLNLLRNAIDAMLDGGEVSIRLLLEDRYIVFRITDTGSGIPAELRDKIFDLFFTTKPKGTGLGLAICKKIVQDHGGSITVECPEGKGTAVIVKLPYRGIIAKQGALN